MRVKHYALILASIGLTQLAFAAPVVNVDSDTSTETALVANHSPSADSTSSVELQLLTRLNALQAQVESLQGQNEILKHQLQQLQQGTQRNYVTLDQRLSALETSNKPTINSVVAPSGSVSATSVTSVDNVDDQSAYQQAYGLITTRQYPKALTALQEFIKQYPQSELLPNAKYWQGQILLMQGDSAGATQLFKQLIKQFPNSSKAPDAALKLATMSADVGKKDSAIQQLHALIKQYPDAPAAESAKQQLKQWQVK